MSNVFTKNIKSYGISSHALEQMEPPSIFFLKRTHTYTHNYSIVGHRRIIRIKY